MLRILFKYFLYKLSVSLAYLWKYHGIRTSIIIHRKETFVGVKRPGFESSSIVLKLNGLK